MTGIIFTLAFMCGFIVYRIGFKDGQRISDGGRLKNLIQKKPKITEEEKRLSKGMENILNYANRKTKGGVINE